MTPLRRMHSSHCSSPQTLSPLENLSPLSADTSPSEHPKFQVDNFAYQAGIKSFYIHGPWICTWEDPGLFSTNLDPQGNAVKVSENDKNMYRWLQRHFMYGLDTQRGNAATWIRRNGSRVLGVSESDLLNPEIRDVKFREEIGWDSEIGRYSTFDVPILHKDWQGGYSPSSAFLNPKLMWIYLSLLHRPSVVRSFMDTGPVQAQTMNIAQAHKIRSITPGAIATCAILARWSLSADDTLEKVGSITGICYFDDFEKYLHILNMSGNIDIMKQWDKEIFPVE